MTVERNTKCVCSDAARLRQADDARQGARHLHDGELRIAPECVLARQAHDEVQALVLNARERPCRIQAERCEDGLDFLGEVVREPIALFRGRCLGVHELDALGRQRRENQLIQQLILVLDQRQRAFVNRRQLFGHAHAVGAGAERAQLLALLQAGDADLEELIEVRAGDAEKPDALQQRQRFVVHLREHALVEVEKRQLPIDVVLGSLEIHVEHGGDAVRRSPEDTTGPLCACVTAPAGR